MTYNCDEKCLAGHVIEATVEYCNFRVYSKFLIEEEIARYVPVGGQQVSVFRYCPNCGRLNKELKNMEKEIKSVVN